MVQAIVCCWHKSLHLPECTPAWSRECRGCAWVCRASDPHKLSRRKKVERIEPLFDRYNDPQAWRLSRRRG